MAAVIDRIIPGSIFRLQTEVQIFSAVITLVSEAISPGFNVSLNEFFPS